MWSFNKQAGVQRAQCCKPELFSIRSQDVPAHVSHGELFVVNEPGSQFTRLTTQMPYFHFGTWHTAYQRQIMYSRGTKSSDSLNRERVAQDRHLPLTLDEYCNPGFLEETLYLRNQDQVIARIHADGRLNAGSKREHKRKQTQPETRFLMVHQVWMYRFENSNILAFPEIVLREPTIQKALLEHESIFSLSDEARHLYTVAQWLSAFVGLLSISCGLQKPLLDMF